MRKPAEESKAALETWRPLEGRWSGRMRVWFSTGEPEVASDAGASLTLDEEGRQLELTWDWLYDERRQTAVLSASARTAKKIDITWSDTFHTSSNPMKLAGWLSQNGLISARGTYPGEKDEVWGWRIDLDPTGARSLRIAMYNVSPQGKEELAVEGIFRR